MKSKITALLSILLVSTFSFAASEVKSKFEIRPMQGTNVVLISSEMAQSIVDVNKDKNLDEAAKVKKINSILVDLVKVKSANTSEETYCKIAGETYKTVNRTAIKTTDRCEKTIEKLDDVFQETLTDYTDVEDLREKYSLYLMLAITFEIL